MSPDPDVAIVPFYHLSTRFLSETDKAEIRSYEEAQRLSQSPILYDHPDSLTTGKGEFLLWVYTNPSSEANTMRIIVRSCRYFSKTVKTLLLRLYRASTDKSVVGIRFHPEGGFSKGVGSNNELSFSPPRKLTPEELASFLAYLPQENT